MGSLILWGEFDTNADFYLKFKIPAKSNPAASVCDSAESHSLPCVCQ